MDTIVVVVVVVVVIVVVVVLMKQLDKQIPEWSTILNEKKRMSANLLCFTSEVYLPALTK